MDLLFVAREGPGLPPTKREIADPPDARVVLTRMPHGAQVGPLVARQAVGALVLAAQLDRGAARAAIGVAITRSQPRAVVLLGPDVGRELLGEGLPLVGGIRELHGRPIGALGQGKGPDIERILADLCQRAGVGWAPPSSRATTARSVVRAEEAEVQATALIEKGQWQQTVDTLRAAEPLGLRGTNMLGRALLQLGDRDGARHAFERTLAADPTNAIAQRQLNTLNLELGNA